MRNRQLKDGDAMLQRSFASPILWAVNMSVKLRTGKLSQDTFTCLQVAVSFIQATGRSTFFNKS